MEVKADGEAVPGLARHSVLAAQVLAVGAEEELALMDEAEDRCIAVMARGNPLRAVPLGALAGDLRRTAAKPAIGTDLG